MKKKYICFLSAFLAVWAVVMTVMAVSSKKEITALRKSATKTYLQQLEEYSEEMRNRNARYRLAKGEEAIQGTLNGQPVIIGKTLKFGRYEQDNEPSNGWETIEWIVAEVTPGDPGEVLLVSEKVLDVRKLHSPQEPVEWAESDIRKWLNQEFYQKGFLPEDKSRFAGQFTKVDDCPINPANDTFNFGPSCSDSVFLLNMSQALRFFMTDAALDLTEAFPREKESEYMTEPQLTEYAQAQSKTFGELALRPDCLWYMDEEYLFSSYDRTQYDLERTDGRWPIRIGQLRNYTLKVRPAVIVRMDDMSPAS